MNPTLPTSQTPASGWCEPTPDELGSQANGIALDHLSTAAYLWTGTPGQFAAAARFAMHSMEAER